jgi:cytochrome c-type biogenesis protein CcmH
MTFWIIVTLLMLTAAAGLALPVLQRRTAPMDAASHDLQVYKDQIAEIEAEHRRGDITAAEAEAARTEVARRMLAADARRQAAEGTPGGHGRIAAVIVALLVPLAAVGIYAKIGSPGMPAAPFAEKAPDGTERIDNLQAMAARLQRRLEADPTNKEGWRLLGQTFMELRRFDEAARSYEKALGLDAGNVDVMAAYGEALVFANEGTVAPASRAAFESVLATAPTNPRAQYYLAIADEQAGKRQAALDRWAALLKTAPPGAAWAVQARKRATALAGALGLDPAIVLPAAPAERGPSQQDIETARSMTPEQRQAMIASMVQQLADRLKENPDDLPGWLRLARAYTVLKQHGNARDTLAKAAALAPKNVDVLMLQGRAIRTASGNRQTAESVAVMRRVLTLDPKNVEALWLVGRAEVQDSKREDGLAKMQRAIDLLPAGVPARVELQKHLDSQRAKPK